MTSAIMIGLNHHKVYHSVPLPDMAILRHVLVESIIETKGLIALAAAALTIQTQVQVGAEPHWHPYIAVVFFATLSVYNIHRLVSVRSHPEALDTEKHQWVRDHTATFYVVMAVATAGLLLSLQYLSWQILVVLFPLGLVTFLYSASIQRKLLYPLKFRQLPYVKIFAISIVWALTTTAIPIHLSDFDWTWLEMGGHVFERSLFVFALTLPFDARDMQSDAADGLITIPIRIGAEKSYQLASSIMVVFMAWCAIKYGMMGSLHLVGAFLISGSFTFIVLTSQKFRSLPHYHYGILDGMMLLQGIIVIVTAFIF
jgi:4-hydroxybenzoate polyprenyltransferase